MKRYAEYENDYKAYVQSCTDQGHTPSVSQYFFIAQRLLEDYEVKDPLKEGGPKQLHDDLMQLPFSEYERFMKDIGDYLRHLMR